VETAIATSGLRRTFGEFVAVDGVDLAVPRGSLYGFLGPNGAGKSTTIKCLTGLLAPSAGSISLLGLDPLADPVAAKRQVGVVPEDLALFEQLTASETLAFVGQVHGLPADTVRARSRELLAVMDLSDAAGLLVADYSHGMRKKTSLAAALLPAPKLLFLDEPFEGIDAVATRELRDLLQKLVATHRLTVFLTSHVLEVVEKLCTHVGILSQGRLAASGTLAEMRRGPDGAPRSLEEMFMDTVGAGRDDAAAGLDWLTRGTDPA